MWQNRSSFFVAMGLCVLLSVCFGVFDICGVGQSSSIELEGQINPNDASVASLVRLPGIGFVRAKAIVVYRENYANQGEKDKAFKGCNDLKKIKGIGPAVVEGICKNLKFE